MSNVYLSNWVPSNILSSFITEYFVLNFKILHKIVERQKLNQRKWHNHAFPISKCNLQCRSMLKKSNEIAECNQNQGSMAENYLKGFKFSTCSRSLGCEYKSQFW